MDDNSSFEFRPLPLLGNPHVQTILSSLLPGQAFSAVSRLRVVELPDGDRLALHDSAPSGWRPGDPVAMLIHGLTGCHRSSYIVRLAGMLLRRGLRVVRMDLRGTGAGFTLARRAYQCGWRRIGSTSCILCATWSPGRSGGSACSGSRSRCASRA
jgi:predicted alpha/beta-fold hydrolase